MFQFTQNSLTPERALSYFKDNAATERESEHLAWDLGMEETADGTGLIRNVKGF